MISFLSYFPLGELDFGILGRKKGRIRGLGDHEFPFVVFWESEEWVGILCKFLQ
jgi:hypothetical protein